MHDPVSQLNNSHEYVKDYGWWIIAVDKVGGGTIGHEYPGMWDVVVYGPNGTLIEEVPVTTGMLHTHQAVADFVNEDLRGDKW